MKAAQRVARARAAMESVVRIVNAARVDLVRRHLRTGARTAVDLYSRRQLAVSEILLWPTTSCFRALESILSKWNDGPGST